MLVTVERKNERKQFTVMLNESHQWVCSLISGKAGKKICICSKLIPGNTVFSKVSLPVFQKPSQSLKIIWNNLLLLLNPAPGAYKGMGGFASMTQIFPTPWDWENFWNITAMFSIILAFMNFLPIPMLDGGYILFTLFEIVTGKKCRISFWKKANMIGFLHHHWFNVIY